MYRLSSSVAAVAATCALVSGCGGSGLAASGNGPVRYAAHGTFTMATALDPASFDPLRSRFVLGLSVLAYDSLVNQLPDGRFVSGLAEKWSVNARSAVFTLRKGTTCSDGAPLTASQVATSIAWASDPKNQSPQYGVNTPTVPLTATGDDASGTVRVALRSPYGFLLNTVGRVPVVCARGMKDPKLLVSSSDGTGPFVLTSVVPGQSYTFNVRRGYTWGPGGASTSAPGTPSKVVIKVITNETTAANLLLSGELNLAKITGQDYRRLDARGLKRTEWKVAGAWLTLNQRGRPTADPAVRQALIAALNRDQLLKVSTAGTGSVPTGLLALEPKGCPGDTVAGQLPRYDVAAAGALLDKAGWTKGADGVRAKNGRPLTIDLHYLPGASNLDKPTAELVAVMWKALGVRMKVTADTASSSQEVMFKSGNYDVYLSGWGFSLPSQLVPYLSGPVPPKGNNIAGIDNKNYSALVAKAAGLMPSAACTYWNQAEQAIIRSADLAPISNRAEHWFLQKAQARMQPYDAPIPTSLRLLG